MDGFGEAVLGMRRDCQEICYDLYVVWSLSSTDGCAALTVIGHFCMCLCPHSHSKPTILSPRFISCHFLALHRTLCL